MDSDVAVKSHVIKLTIWNKTGYQLTNPDSWFDSGRVADGWSIPGMISPGDQAVVEMYERDWALAGCSGWIKYDLNGGKIYIAFSNPASGRNKLGCGTDKSVWDQMGNHDYDPFTEELAISGVTFVASEKCTGGDVNEAIVALTVKQ